MLWLAKADVVDAVLTICAERRRKSATEKDLACWTSFVPGEEEEKEEEESPLLLLLKLNVESNIGVSTAYAATILPPLPAPPWTDC